MLANWITLSRLPLLGLVIALLHLGSPAVRLAAVGLLFAGLMLDTVDGIVARKRGVAQGSAPFLQHHTRLGRFLVGSTWMRTSYAVTKIVTFCGLALATAIAGGPRAAAGAGGALLGPLTLLAWGATALCVLRGLPVMLHAARHYWRAVAAPAPSSAPAPRPARRATP
jgi:hypothetical protein